LSWDKDGGNVNFGKLVNSYFGSQSYFQLTDHSREMYKLYIERLRTIGGHMPVTDRDMRIAVAVARSPHKVKKGEPKTILCHNLTQWWAHSIDNWLDDRGKDATASTKNTLLSYLKIVYKHGINHYAITVADNPTVGIERWTHTPAIGNPLTAEEADHLEREIPSMPEDIQPYAYFWLFMYDAGARPDELYKHQREWFTKRGKDTFLEIWDAKARAKGVISRYVRLIDRQKRVLQWFDKQPKHFGYQDYTFRTDKGKKFDSTWTVLKIKEICSILGIEERTPYDARRGLATTLYGEVQAGDRSFQEIQDRLGHIKEYTTKRYIIQNQLVKAAGYRAPKASGA
jgi:integrase